MAFGAILLVTLWIDFSSIHRHHNADSLVPVLISLQQWTPLFWEQDRLGMLIPLLALPFKHPLANLLVQYGVTTFCALGCFFLLGWYAAGRRHATTIGSICGILLLGCLTSQQRFDCLMYFHQYATSLSLGLAALILLGEWQRSGRWYCVAASLMLMLGAHWVNPSIAFALGPLAILGPLLPANRAHRPLSRQESGWMKRNPLPAAERTNGLEIEPAPAIVAGVSLVAVSLLASIALSRAAAEPLPYGFVSPGQWWLCAVGIIDYMPENIRPKLFKFLLGLFCGALATLGWTAGRRELRRSALVLLALLIPALVQFAFMASLDHVHRTHYGHYVFAAVFLLIGGVSAFVVLQFAALLPARFAAPGSRALLIAFVVVGMVRQGPPSLGAVRQGLDQAAGAYTAELLEARCTHVTGDYWRVWPAVFHANLELRERGASGTVWGIAQRALPTTAQWSQVPLSATRIAEIKGDEAQALHARRHYRVSETTVVAELSKIRVLAPVALANTAPRPSR